MATEKNITMKEFNGTDYDILYPKTKVIQIDGFDDSIAKIVPVGSIYWYTSTTIPDGFLLCDGSKIGRTDYSSLFAVIGTAFGSGDGSTTFSLPDLRAKFIRGSGTSNGYYAYFGQTQTATSVSDRLQAAGAVNSSSSDREDLGSNWTGGPMFGSSGSYTLYSEHFRPYNIALTPIIKY